MIFFFFFKWKSFKWKKDRLHDLVLHNKQKYKWIIIVDVVVWEAFCQLRMPLNYVTRKIKNKKLSMRRMHHKTFHLAKCMGPIMEPTNFLIFNPFLLHIVIAIEWVNNIWVYVACPFSPLNKDIVCNNVWHINWHIVISLYFLSLSCWAYKRRFYLRWSVHLIR